MKSLLLPTSHSCAVIGLLPLFLTAPTGFAQLYQVRRLNDAKPVITQEMFTRLGCDERQGRNINGPSVVALPDWLKAEERADPQARYYMYFAHHGGQYIRMAWASNPVGPWTLYQTGKDVPVGRRGVLDMGEDLHLQKDGVSMKGHIASPEVVVDQENRRFVMFFHGMGGNTGWHVQYTMTAASATGLDFNQGLLPCVPGRGYFRVFTAQGKAWALSNGASLWQAPGLASTPTQDVAISAPEGFHRGKGFYWQEKRQFKKDIEGPWAGKLKVGQGQIRHVSLLKVGENRFHMFYSVKKDNPPERILLSVLDASDPDWRNWTLSPAVEVLRPREPWEGVNFPIETSKKGGASGGVHQLRDPFVFRDSDDRIYLYYTGSGEDAIGVAELIPQDDSTGE